METQTFLRQKITLALSGSPSAAANGSHRDSDIEGGFKPSLMLNTSHSLQCSSDDADSNRYEVAHVGKPTTDQCIRAVETTGSDHVEYTANESQRKGEKGVRSSYYSGFNGPDYGKTGREENSTPITCNKNERKSVHSPSKVNKNTTGAGVLRYALHLRFLCPPFKKSSRSVQRGKSGPASAPARNMNIEGERRFYLYNDLRVVFPQRHSDSDEGKVISLDFIYLYLYICSVSLYCYTSVSTLHFGEMISFKLFPEATASICLLISFMIYSFAGQLLKGNAMQCNLLICLLYKC